MILASNDNSAEVERPALNHHFFFCYLKDESFPQLCIHPCRGSILEKPRSWCNLKLELDLQRSYMGFWFIIQGHFPELLLVPACIGQKASKLSLPYAQ